MNTVFMFLVLLVLLFTPTTLANNAAPVTYNDPDFFIVLGENDNLTHSALTFDQTAGAAVMASRGWTVAQLTAFYNEARSWYASRYGIYFDDTGAAGANTPYFALSRNANAILTPLLARGKYRVYGTIDPDSILPTFNPQSNPPIVTLVEYVVTFNLSAVFGASWAFTPFNYGGSYAVENGVPPAVVPTDNLSFGIYNISWSIPILGLAHNEDYYMRVPYPDHTDPAPSGMSTERGEICSVAHGPGLGALRVDAFPSAPNAHGLFPTSTTAVWHFFSNPSRAAIPALYNFAPQHYHGPHEPVSCLATV
jgi:hypothetical protein